MNKTPNNHADKENIIMQTDVICKSFTEIGEFVLSQYDGDEDKARNVLPFIFALLESNCNPH